MTSSLVLHACTTATRAQLPAARVLCDSLRRHHPDAEITLLLVDDVDGAERDPPGVRLVSPASVGVPADVLSRLATACTATELADALAPRLVRTLVEAGAPAVVAFAPETEVFAPLPDVVEGAGEHGIVLTFRLDGPFPDDGHEPTAVDLAAAGSIASEFVAVGAAATQFLDWWCEREERAALEPGGAEPWGPWTELVPALFPFHALRDPGCGASIWNLHTRDIGVTNDGYDVSGSPLRWFHFDGYSPGAPHLLSAPLERPRILLGDRPALARLCDEHGARLRAAGFDAAEPVYGYAALADGREIDARMRRMYVDALHDASARGDPEPPSPFAPAGPDDFAAWIDETTEPPTDPRVSRYFARVWHEDGTIQEVFPSLAAEGAEEYLGWIRTAGHYDHDVPAWVVPSEDHVRALRKRRWRERPTAPWSRGVNVVGYVTAVLGVGEVSRLLASTLETAGAPLAVIANRTTMSQQSLAFDSWPSSAAPYDVNVLCVNADHTTHLAQQLGPEFFADRRTIGVWFWEVEDFPPSMTEAFAIVDEVWVASDFVLEAIAPVAPKPVRKFPLPVVQPSAPDGVTRSELGLPEDRFVFLFVYDFLSTAERKNPVGLIEAYTRAFGPDDGTTLVLKSINGEQRIPELERVRLAAEGRSDVIVRDAYLAPEQHSALLTLCDAYVSLHRSEGFGMDMAKAMGLGKPVVATGYSGNLEFMDDATAYLVDYDLVPVGPGCEPYPADSRWAQPRVDHAAELMRRVVERPDEARERGRRAEARIRTDFSLASRGDALAQMLDGARDRGAIRGWWRKFFMDGWRERRRRRADLPTGTLDWLPDGAPIDPTMRRLLTASKAAVPDPEVDLAGFYGWLNERVFPPAAPVVSRYLYERWCDRSDLRSHFPSLDPNPRRYLEWLIAHGHSDTDIPYQLLPSEDDLHALNRYQELQARRQQRRERVAEALRSAGRRATGRANPR
jgi:glycosyltransferase involved in cell wall biosynthesis